MRRLRSERGGLYLEALIALAILALAMLPIITAVFITPGSERSAGDRMTALNLARATLEELKRLHHEEWDDRDREELVGNVTYTVEVLEAEPTGVEGLYTATVIVTWPGGSVSLTTQIAEVW